MRWARRATIAVLLAAGGCSGNGGGASDAGPGDAAPDARPRVPAPAPAEAPQLTPCPEGWRETTGDDGVTVCDAWPEGGPQECAAHEAHFPGEPGCTRVGAPCPDGDFPADLPDGPRVFVREGETGGDGSRGAPFGSVQPAIDAAEDGTTVVIAPGRYVEELSVERPLTLLGACAERVIVGPTPDSPEQGLFADRTDVEVRNLQLRSGYAGLVSGLGATVRLRGVVGDGAGSGNGLGLLRGSIDAQEIVIRGLSGDVASVTTEGTITVQRAVLEGHPDHPLAVSSDRVEIRDAHLRTADGEVSAPLLQVHGADDVLVLERAWVRGPGAWSLFSFGGGLLTVRDAVFVGDPEGAPTALDAVGVGLFDGSRAELERVRAEHAARGLIAGGTGTTVDARDLVLRDVTSDAAAAQFGRGLSFEGGAAGTLERVWVGRARQAAVFSDGPATVTVRDLTVVETRSDATGFAGRAINAQGGAIIEGERVRLERNREVALLGASEGTQVTLGDVTVRDTRPRACAEDRCEGAGAGHGVGSYLGARVRVERFTICDNTLAGVQVAREGELDLLGGTVCNNLIGANVQIEGYDLERLTNEVLYRGNDRQLDAERLPIPEI